MKGAETWQVLSRIRVAVARSLLKYVEPMSAAGYE